MSSETIQIMSTSSYPSTFLTIFEPGIMRSMAVPKEYLKYNGEKEFPDEYLYITKNNIIFDPIAIEIYWQMVRNNLKKKIASSNATTFLEVSDEC